VEIIQERSSLGFSLAIKRKGSVARRRGKESEECLTVRIRQVTTPDSERRLSRAIEVLLRSAAGELKESTNVNKKRKSH
jgi:hypothetical protein